MMPRIATVSDLTDALAQGLNWCYPTYVQASSTDRSLQVYAASQPGKCGADSQRQLIKIELDPTKTIAPIYVFILGPKPSETYKTGKLTTQTGRKITIHNFHQPATVSGFRNLRERFATASSPTPTSCYDAKNCPIQQNAPVAQTVTIPDTSITTQTTIQDPVLIVGESRGSSSSSYLVSTSAPRGSSSSQAYLAPPGSSSSQSYKAPPTSVSSSVATLSGSSKQSTTSDIDNNADEDEDTDTTNRWSNNASLKRKNTTYIQNITETVPESSQEYVALKQGLAALKREKASTETTQVQQTASQPKSFPQNKHPETYDPNANFLVNLFAEMHSDLTRLARGTQVASRA